jgi:nicotinamidase-related amidase
MQDLLCRAEDSQLLIIDVQTKLGSVMPGKVLARVVQNTNLLLEAAKLLNVPVLATEQYPRGLGPLVAAVGEALAPATPRFEKTCFSCVAAEGLLSAVRAAGRRQLVLTGMEAHICVLQSAIELLDEGFKVFVIEDAICSRKLENYQNALVRLQQCGVFVVSAESVVFEWLRDAKHEHFKTIWALLR